MLAIQKQSKYVKKQIRLPDGSLALVVFELLEINGKITAKAVCGKLIEETTKNGVPSRGEVLALPIYFEIETFKPIVSPFFSDIISLIKDLSFIISQPARGPNVV